MSYTRYIHNVSGSTKTYRGVPIADDAFYEIEPANLTWYQSSDAIAEDLASGDIRMSADGLTDYATTPAKNIAFLLGFYGVDPNTGSPTVSTRKLPPSWYMQYREIAFETATLNSVHDKDKERNDLGATTIKYYDDSFVELTSPSQATLDSDCAVTVVKFQPSTEWGVRAVLLGHKEATTNHIYVNADVNVLVAPSTYSTLPQANGGLDLYFVGPYEHKGVKDENFVFFTSNDFIEFHIDHGIGVKHEIQCIMDIALPMS